MVKLQLKATLTAQKFSSKSSGAAFVDTLEGRNEMEMNLNSCL